MRDAWRLAKPYWLSDDKKWAWGLLLAVTGLNLGTVYINVRLSFWQNDLFNALQKLDATVFFSQLAVFALLAVTFIAVAVYQAYLKQMLHLRWRQWLTKQYLEEWLEGKAYYRLELENNETDNPDQRIAEDLDRFTDITLSLGLGLLNAVVTLSSFLGILWSLSGSLAVGPFDIPGYMVWVALVYAGFGTWVTHRIGRPLVALNFLQQRYEADFRFGLVRLRENTEAVALFRGEQREATIFQGLFGHVVDNFRAIMNRTKMLGWWTFSYSQIGFVFPFIVAAPRFFAKQIQLGGLMQTSQAFGTVQSSLFFVIDSYSSIANWQSVVQRLIGFDARVRTVATDSRAPQSIVIERGGEGLEIRHLNLKLPNGKLLLNSIELEAESGEAILLTGPTGCGKSTLLRSIAGIWPYGGGEIRIGVGELMFLPQKPYLPLGTLRDAFCYPYSATDNRLEEIMQIVGLSNFKERLDERENWAQRLSLGEQQRIAFTRILLKKPHFVFLDEATSALDESSEAYFYRILRETSWRPTIISVGHRSTLEAFHEQKIVLSTRHA